MGDPQQHGAPCGSGRRPSVTREEYDKFYQERFGDPAAPLSVITVSAEGAVTYKALLYIPSQAPSQYYTEDYKPGLQLYASGVMIMDSCADLLPDYFNFVRGVVESPDLSLNISRELLQHDRQLKIISANLEKKIKAELERMLKDDRESYEKFYRSFRPPAEAVRPGQLRPRRRNCRICRCSYPPPRRSWVRW